MGVTPLAQPLVQSVWMRFQVQQTTPLVQSAKETAGIAGEINTYGQDHAKHKNRLLKKKKKESYTGFALKFGVGVGSHAATRSWGEKFLSVVVELCSQ